MSYRFRYVEKWYPRYRRILWNIKSTSATLYNKSIICSISRTNGKFNSVLQINCEDTEFMYKTIEISNDNILSDADKEAIALFNKTFKKSEIFLEFKDGKLYLNAREVDINKVRNSVDYINNITNSKILLHILSQIESIRSYGLKNGRRNFVDYNKERKVKHRGKKEEKRGQYYYARNNKFSMRNNKIPSKYENKIICGDSLRILKQLPDNCIDLIFTSPPYNFGLDYENNEDDHYWEDY
ncbi:hypothetical protein DRQ29_03610, partial [bacterium]